LIHNPLPLALLVFLAHGSAAGFGFALIELGYGYVFDYFALGKALLKLHEPN